MARLGTSSERRVVPASATTDPLRYSAGPCLTRAGSAPTEDSPIPGRVPACASASSGRALSDLLRPDRWPGTSRSLRVWHRLRDPGGRLRDPAGVLSGEVDLSAEAVQGIAVHIGARVAAIAGPSEVLVSSTYGPRSRHREHLRGRRRARAEGRPRPLAPGPGELGHLGDVTSVVFVKTLPTKPPRVKREPDQVLSPPQPRHSARIVSGRLRAPGRVAFSAHTGREDHDSQR